MKIILVLIMILLNLTTFLNPVLASPNNKLFLCNYSGENLKGTYCSAKKVSVRECDMNSDGNSRKCPDGVTSCLFDFFHMSYATGGLDVPYQDIKRSTFNVSVADTVTVDNLIDSYHNEHLQGTYSYFDISTLTDVGCGINNPENDCQSAYEYFFNKLSTKFPLDIFVPIYNFNSDETACPEITLFGHTLEFCAITMVGKSVKYIFLITFIMGISSLQKILEFRPKLD